jgi:tryptophanyl-tRNA synthetase
LRIYAAFVPAAEAEATRAALISGSMTWGELKSRTLEALDATIGPMRERYTELLADRAQLDRVLAAGASRARPQAQATMRRVRAAVGVGV